MRWPCHRHIDLQQALGGFVARALRAVLMIAQEPGPQTVQEVGLVEGFEDQCGQMRLPLRHMNRTELDIDASTTVTASKAVRCCHVYLVLNRGLRQMGGIAPSQKFAGSG